MKKISKKKRKNAIFHKKIANFFLINQLLNIKQGSNKEKILGYEKKIIMHSLKM